MTGAVNGVDMDERPAWSTGVIDVSARRLIGYCLAVLGVATAVIHFSVAGEHFHEYWLFGVFMLVVGWPQLLWAVVVAARPSRSLAWLGIGGNAAVVAVYLVTRTVGDLVGPTPREVEPVGFVDALCAVFELAVVAGCGALLVARGSQRPRRRPVAVVSAVTVTVVAGLLSASLVVAGPETDHDGMGADGMGTDGMGADGMSAKGMGGSAEAAAIRLPTTSPAGQITMPDRGMPMGRGMAMADPRPCTAVPSADQQAAAVNLVDAAWRDARKYQSLAAAQAAGYRPVTPTGRPVVHYINPASYRAVLGGGSALDTAAPPSLVYANTAHGAVLVAAMFIAAPGGPAPQPGGCLTQWHVHTNLCLARAAGVVGVADPDCPAGSKNRVTPPMLHIWFVPVPGGPTAIDAPDTQVVAAAEQVPGPANGTA